MLGEASSTLESIEDIDRWAWEAICHWPDRSGFEVCKDGIDYAQLTRYFLWDKVARSLRRQQFPAQFDFEASLMSASPGGPQAARAGSEWNFRRPLRAGAAYGRAAWVRVQGYLSQHPTLYVPRSHHQLKRAVAELARSPGVMAVTHCSQALSGAKLPTISTRPGPPRRDSFTCDLYQAMVSGLKAHQVTLLEADQALLWQQLQQQQQHLQAVASELAMLRPAGIFVFSDNHYPSQEYVAVAQRDGIPAIMLQHGLDCEQFCLEEAYASTIAVWGEARQRRYQQFSHRQPIISVTGNPEYDHLRLPDRLDPSGQYWLWVTRPHAPHKCYAPSRHPNEALAILDAVLKALRSVPDARLVIKPHPIDCIGAYQARLANEPLASRVEISSQSLHTLFPQASTVITEDSTAGLEAMFWGKPLVHAHFTASKPAVPFVEYGAALPAYSDEMLQAALDRSQTLTPPEQEQLLQAQRYFLQDFAGPCDGQAAQRVVALVINTFENL